MPCGRVGLGERQLAGGDAVRPVAEQVERPLRVEPADVARHEHLRAARHAGAAPRLRPRSRTRRAPCGIVARSRRAERVARLAGAALDDVQPLALALDLLRCGNSLFAGTLQHREPVDRRIILRRRRRVRRRHRRQVEQLARRGLHLGRIDEAVAAHPDAVIGLRQIGNDVAALSSVTTILANLRRQVRVSAITQTPASGPLGPVTTPPISASPILIAASWDCCASAGPARRPEIATRATVATPKTSFCFVVMSSSPMSLIRRPLTSRRGVSLVSIRIFFSESLHPAMFEVIQPIGGGVSAPNLRTRRAPRSAARAAPNRRRRMSLFAADQLSGRCAAVRRDSLKSLARPTGLEPVLPP